MTRPFRHARRHQTLRTALLLVYLAVLIVVVAMVLVAVSVTVPSPGVAAVASVAMLTATAALLVGLTLVAASVRQSADAIDYEVDRVLQLGSADR